MVEFPENAHKCLKFLKQSEIDWAMQRINDDRGDAAPEPFSLRSFIEAGKDLKLWLLGLIFWYDFPDADWIALLTYRSSGLTTVNYSVSFFLPIILKQMGFSTAKAQLLTAPPFVLAGLLCVSCGWVGEESHVHCRGIGIKSVLSTTYS